MLLEVSSVSFEYEGKPAVLSMARDVTRAEGSSSAQLVQADRLAALGTMAAGVAHEINNPLAYVMLNLEWIARKLPELERDPSASQALIGDARRGAASRRRARRRRSSASSAASRAPTARRGGSVDVAARGRSRRSGSPATRSATARASSTLVRAARPVWANESRLEQVFLNLLVNAAQAMPEGDARRATRSASGRGQDGERRVVLEVSDTGAGIPPDVLPRIFDPFFTTKPVGVGTGLGLSICHGIVTSLGGQIEVDSEPGEGTTFRVVLPTTDTVVGEEAQTPWCATT